jgi:RimJ/RimL family protein N-acetyltransferase
MDNGNRAPLMFEPIVEGDIEMVEQWLDDPESRRRLGGMVPFRPCFAYQQAQADYHLWTVYAGATPVGLGGFEMDTDRTAALVLLVAPGHRRWGYGTRILLELCARSEALRAARLLAPVERDNEAAMHCLESVGFTDTGPDPDDPELLRFVRKTE